MSVPGEWVERNLALAGSRFPDDHFVMLTSGSTGLPKLVIGSKARSQALVEALHLRQHSEPLVETIGALPLSYSFAFVNQWLWSHIMSRQFISTPGLAQPQPFTDALQRARGAMLCLVGIQAPLLIQMLDGRSFPGIARVHFAGGRFPQERLPELRNIFPEARIFNNYGCAEAMPRLTLRPAEQSPDPANVGIPIEGIEMRSAADGAIEFRSPFSAVAVIENGTLSEVGPDTWTQSGDLGVREADGSWTLRGRASEVFKRHGEKVSVSALTATLAQEWKGQLAIYRETDPAGEEGCVLAIAPMATEEQVRGLLRTLRTHHPRAHWPLRIENLPSLPELSNGKPDLPAIRSYPERTIAWAQRL